MQHYHLYGSYVLTSPAWYLEDDWLFTTKMIAGDLTLTSLSQSPIKGA